MKSLKKSKRHNCKHVHNILTLCYSRNGEKQGLRMPPVEELVNFPVFHSCKERYRVGGEGGPLGVGRCSYSIYKDVLVNPTVQSVNLESFVGACTTLV